MGLFGSTSAAQRPLSRSIGNAQARNPALPGMPAYGNTTNPNGAQTAVQSPMVSPSLQVFGAVRQAEQNQLQSMPTTPAPAPYPGGDVPGLASFYRNRATQNYMPPSAQVSPDMAGNSAQAARIAGSLPVGTSPAEIAQFNGYDGATQAFNDPTRLTPTQREFIARQSAQNAGQMDPTGLGQRFGAGSALGQQAAGIAAGQAGVAAGTHMEIPGGYGNLPSYIPVNHQAEQQRMAGIAGSSAERALNPNSTGTQFAYRGPNGEMISTNRLGMLQQMDKNSIVKDPAVQSAIELQKQKNAELVQKHEDRKAFTREKNGGLTGRQMNRIRTKERVMRRAVKEGIIEQSTMDERIAGIKKDFRTNNEWGDLQRSISSTFTPPSGLKLPNGQYPADVRNEAKDRLSKILEDKLDDNAKPGDRFIAESIRSMGLHDGLNPSQAIEKMFSYDINSADQFAPLVEYWKLMETADADWKNKSSLKTERTDALSLIMNEAAKIPSYDLPKWFEANKDRIMAARIKTPPLQSGPGPAQGMIENHLGVGGM